jgi:hypothetical protein
MLRVCLLVAVVSAFLTPVPVASAPATSPGGGLADYAVSFESSSSRGVGACGGAVRFLVLPHLLTVATPTRSFDAADNDARATPSAMRVVLRGGRSGAEAFVSDRCAVVRRDDDSSPAESLVYECTLTDVAAVAPRPVPQGRYRSRHSSAIRSLRRYRPQK